jgi:hypothetical protein
MQDHFVVGLQMRMLMEWDKTFRKRGTGKGFDPKDFLQASMVESSPAALFRILSSPLSR